MRFEGVVQGVGFRPHVYRLAQELGLAGFVGNDAGGVFLEVEGPAVTLELFLARLREKPPAAAHIERIRSQPLKPRGEEGFVIAPSQGQSLVETLISPDLDVCAECLAEVNDPSDRRYDYPFTNCTHCGPRFTLLERLPYDRRATSMASFSMCPLCQAEYDDPENRRFHAQPNACPKCGPQLGVPLRVALDCLRQGGLLAVKGVGGYHLVCDAENGQAIATLRTRKNRHGKPLAVMVDGLETARRVAFLDADEAELLASRAKPIVILRSRGVLPEALAPGTGTLGLLLPYSPLHHLLMSRGGFRALVMTSANLSGEPIVTCAEDAEGALTSVVDLFLHHDRPIRTACDDSVVRRAGGALLPLRRSRGYAPYPVPLPFDVPPAVATGGQLKSTFCLGRARHAFLSQHLGDLENLQTWRHYGKALDHLRGLYGLEPALVCADMHPDYLSTRWAQESGWPVVRVQHHHAHLASLMAEHGCPARARLLGLVFDGTGFGSDGTIWGGEVLLADYEGFERRAWLKPVPLAGGDRAIREPWRMALSHLWAAGLPWGPQLAPVKQAGAANLPILRKALENGLGTVPTSSVGRLFDAVAALVGLRQVVEYEAQAAIELEALADRSAHGAYQFGPPFDPLPVLAALLEDLGRGTPVGVISMRFHRAVARASVKLCLEHATEKVVGLTGGVFQNVLLLELVTDGLQNAGFQVLRHRLVPPNDGGLALGQLAVGCRTWMRGKSACV